VRFGFAIAHPDVIREMAKVKDSYNCDAISIAAATAAIEDQEYARGTWALVRAERERLTRGLEGLGWRVPPSQANFVLATVPGERGAAARVHADLKKQGVLVRFFNLPGLDDKLRVTVGTPADTDALLATLRQIER
jgi:histidinol-phosphate aminotransferase